LPASVFADHQSEMTRRSLEKPWPRSPAEARLLQEWLRGQVVTEDQLGVMQRVAGVDVHYGVGRLWAAIVVMTFPDLVAIESALICRPLAFPYLPGLLAFREALAILQGLNQLSEKPDLLLVDGQGSAHSRRFGLAYHLGVLGNVSTIGVAKSRQIGTYREPGIERGAWSELVDRGETIGAVLRTQDAVRPVFVSIGHRIRLKTAIDLVLRCTAQFRLPEPIRAADNLSRQHPVG